MRMKKRTYTDDEWVAIVDRLRRVYKKHIESSVDWNKVLADFRNPENQRPDNEFINCCSLLGSVFTIMPSGEMYNWRASKRDLLRDAAFDYALEDIGFERGVWTSTMDDNWSELYMQIGIEKQADLYDPKLYECILGIRKMHDK
jgi:hypothetical protein